MCTFHPFSPFITTQGEIPCFAVQWCKDYCFCWLLMAQCRIPQTFPIWYLYTNRVISLPNMFNFCPSLSWNRTKIMFLLFDFHYFFPHCAFWVVIIIKASWDGSLGICKRSSLSSWEWCNHLLALRALFLLHFLTCSLN